MKIALISSFALRTPPSDELIYSGGLESVDMVFDKRAADARYRSEHSEEHKVYAKQYYRDNIDVLSANTSMRRKERRRFIQEAWGRVGGEKGTWRNLRWVDAEKIAVKVLEANGFHDVKRLDYFIHSPFDIVATYRDGIRYAFQVTMRTHQDTHKKHIRLANDLGLEWYVFYINPALTKYIIKSAIESGVEELNLTDMEHLTEVKV